MKMPGFLNTKNILLGSGVASTLAGITTVACALMGGNEPAPCAAPPTEDTAVSGVTPLESEEPEG